MGICDPSIAPIVPGMQLVWKKPSFTFSIILPEGQTIFVGVTSCYGFNNSSGWSKRSWMGLVESVYNDIECFGCCHTQMATCFSTGVGGRPPVLREENMELLSNNWQSFSIEQWLMWKSRYGRWPEEWTLTEEKINIRKKDLRKKDLYFLHRSSANWSIFCRTIINNNTNTFTILSIWTIYPTETATKWEAFPNLECTPLNQPSQPVCELTWLVIWEIELVTDLRKIGFSRPLFFRNVNTTV